MATIKTSDLARKGSNSKGIKKSNPDHNYKVLQQTYLNIGCKEFANTEVTPIIMPQQTQFPKFNALKQRQNSIKQGWYEIPNVPHQNFQCLSHHLITPDKKALFQCALCELYPNESTTQLLTIKK